MPTFIRNPMEEFLPVKLIMSAKNLGFLKIINSPMKTEKYFIYFYF